MDGRTLAFLVEGDADKEFVEAFVPRILTGARMRVVRVSGRAALPLSFSSVAELVDRGYNPVVVLGDADSEIPEEVTRYKAKLERALKRPGLEEAVQICLCVPMLEAWLLAAYEDDPEAIRDPKRALAKRIGGHPDIGQLARKLPVEQARARSTSLDKFVRVLEAAQRKPRGGVGGRKSSR